MPPAMPRKRAAEHDRQIDDVRSRQEMAQRESLVEFLRRHPAMLLDDGAPRPHQHPAETSQRHFGERKEQLEQARLVGGCDAGYPAPGRRPAGIPRAWSQNLEWPPPRPTQFGMFPRFARRIRGHFFSGFAPYIEDAGSPAMEINGRRNKPFGPGGSTRRLHPSPPLLGGFRRGRNRIDEGVKGVFFLGMVPPLSGYAIVANDNYAPVAQAA